MINSTKKKFDDAYFGHFINERFAIGLLKEHDSNEIENLIEEKNTVDVFLFEDSNSFLFSCWFRIPL